MSEGRVPPYNEEAEISVLGSVLLDNKCWAEAYAILNDDDFYSENHRLIFTAMGELFSSGTSVDHVTLGHALRRNGDLDKIGGAIALADLTDAVATTANIGHYADIVRETSQIRKLIYEAQKVSDVGYGSSTIEDISDSAADLIAVAQAIGKRRMPDSILSLGDKVLENYRLVAGGYRGIEMPWPSLDNMTAGMWPKTVTMFVARPSTGKTQVAVICARHAWMKGKRVLIVSPEMSKEDMAERFFVIQSGVSYQDVISGELSTNMEQRLKETIDRDRDLSGLYIMDSSDDLTPRGIEAAIRAVDPHLVAVDSMYDIRAKGERRDRMLTALEWLKNSCKENGYAAVGFAQQNRIAELSDKKGGGARLGTIALADEIGQDAHTVIALEQTKDDKADRVLKFVPLKVRRGHVKKTKIKSHWDFDDGLFEEMEDEEETEYGEEIPF